MHIPIALGALKRLWLPSKVQVRKLKPWEDTEWSELETMKRNEKTRKLGSQLVIQGPFLLPQSCLLPQAADILNCPAASTVNDSSIGNFLIFWSGATLNVINKVTFLKIMPYPNKNISCPVQTRWSTSLSQEGEKVLHVRDNMLNEWK